MCANFASASLGKKGAWRLISAAKRRSSCNAVELPELRFIHRLREDLYKTTFDFVIRLNDSFKALYKPAVADTVMEMPITGMLREGPPLLALTPSPPLADLPS